MSDVIDVGGRTGNTGNTPTIKEISVDTQILFDNLAGKAVGDFVPYSTLDNLVGRRVQGPARGCLATARKMLQAEKRMVFDVVRAKGLKRLDDIGIVSTGLDSMKRIRRESKRGARRLACVSDFASLPNEKKIEHNTTVSMLGTLAHMTSGPGIRKLEGRVVEAGGGKLAIGRTLEVFSK